MATTPEIWVFSEKTGLLAELIGGARTLAGGNVSVLALLAGPRNASQDAIARGADGALWLGEIPNDSLLEDIVPTLARLVRDRQPLGLLVGATRRWRAIAGRLAARLETSALTDVQELRLADGRALARHMVFGGGAEREDRLPTGFFIATAGPGLWQAVPSDAARKGELIEVPREVPERRIMVRERRPRERASVNLAAARKVVCVGRGIARQEDLEQMRELAGLLGAELGCSRPLAEGLDWLPRERYIGVSGAMIRPDLYLGIGVSGQVQHTVGMADARVVAAINQDAGAPLFELADYSITADLYTVVPELIRILKQRHQPG